ncbi:hypothetical protein [Devosia nitrariae]|uniref:hypothetical protein n=1 Tax=Devosia nitrariae TaxID=2071872 RepID=UPI0024E0562A|nr:hypothetical protein [Devosia nitrariae]
MIENEDVVHKIHRKSDHVGLGTEPLDTAFMEAISDRLSTAGAILLVGPGSAKVELSAHLHHRHPQVSRRVWAVEPMDHLTAAELAATARKYFRAASRMRG